jgi:hypothetical protein
MKESTEEEKTAFLRRRTNLLGRIRQFRSMREQFIPGLDSYLALSNVPDVPLSTPELIPLYPPSAIPCEHRHEVYPADIIAIEERLRFAQASESLVQLRLQLAKRTCANRYKSRNDASQRYFTRFRVLQKQTETKITTSRVHYNAARSALSSILGPGEWEKTYRILNSSDVVGLGERALAAKEQQRDREMQVLAGLTSNKSSTIGMDAETIYQALEPLPTTEFVPQLARGEGSRTLSWIWYSAGENELENQSTDACKFFFLPKLLS